MRRSWPLLGSLLITLASALGTAGAVSLADVPARRVVKPGATVAGTPANLNVSITVRYGATAKPRAVLVLMPGFLGGAGSLDRLARQVVALDPTVAVWAVDRRANALEPARDLAQADTATLRRLAREGVPARDPKTLGFMREWGLDTTLRDWRSAVLEARSLTPNVYIGGHSLGAVLARLYAAYDFDGQVGAKDVKGLVMIDGVPGMDQLPALTPDQYEGGFLWNRLPAPGMKDLAARPYAQFDGFYDPARASRDAALALLARRDPKGVSDAGTARYPATNLAAFMLRMDGRYGLSPLTAVTTGRATNVRESFLLPAVLVSGDRGWNAREAYNVLDTSKPADWAQDPQAPTDAADFVSRYWLPTGDFTEWYFPARLALDVCVTGRGTRGTPYEKNLRAWHMTSPGLPVLGLAAEQGLTDATMFRELAAASKMRVDVKTLPGYAHLDVVTARSDTVARSILGWMKR